MEEYLCIFFFPLQIINIIHATSVFSYMLLKGLMHLSNFLRQSQKVSRDMLHHILISFPKELTKQVSFISVLHSRLLSSFPHTCLRKGLQCFTKHPHPPKYPLILLQPLTQRDRHRHTEIILVCLCKLPNKQSMEL